jgi:hypothetical protein
MGISYMLIYLQKTVTHPTENNPLQLYTVHAKVHILMKRGAVDRVLEQMKRVCCKLSGSRDLNAKRGILDNHLDLKVEFPGYHSSHSYTC